MLLKISHILKQEFLVLSRKKHKNRKSEISIFTTYYDVFDRFQTRYTHNKMFETHRNVYNCTKMIQKKYKWWWRKVQPKSPSENQYNLSWFLGNPGILLSGLSWPALCALRSQRLLDLDEFNQISIGSNFFVFQFYFNSLKPGINHG